jgi:DNA helicase HerA-like ATPase
MVNEITYKAPDYKVVILDWHGEYYGLLKHKQLVLPMNIPLSIIDKTSWYDTIEVLSEALEITPSQSFILGKIIEKYGKNINSLEDLIGYAEIFTNETGWVRESTLSLLRKLYPLTRSDSSRMFSGFDNNMLSIINNPSNNAVIINTSIISDPFIRRIYTFLFLKKVFKYAIKKMIKHKLLIVIEEANNVLNKESTASFIQRMISEIRKFGVGLIIVTQTLTKIIDDVMLNTNTKIIHSIKSNNDLEIISKSIYLPKEIERILPYLEVGEAVLYTRGLKKPVIIRVKN